MAGGAWVQPPSSESGPAGKTISMAALRTRSLVFESPSSRLRAMKAKIINSSVYPSAPT